MAKDEVKLLGTLPSPFVLRVRFALNIKSIDYEFIVENLASKSDLLLKSNPVHKKVPVLIHEGKPICESQIIVEYIEETWSSRPQLLPSDIYDRATARFWGAYIDEKLFSTIRRLLRVQTEATRTAIIDELKGSLPHIEDAYVKCSQGKPFFGGDQVGYLDIALGCYLGWLRATEVMTGEKLLDSEKVPGLVKWADCFSSDPVMKDLLPETDMLVEYGKTLLSRSIAAARSN